mgnify:CR=1 FL=1
MSGCDGEGGSGGGAGAGGGGGGGGGEGDGGDGGDGGGLGGGEHSGQPPHASQTQTPGKVPQVVHSGLQKVGGGEGGGSVQTHAHPDAAPFMSLDQDTTGT